MSLHLYNKYSHYLKKKYGEKIYKLPINLPLTCPNRDGLINDTGCIFCGEKAAGHESLSSDICIKEQLLRNKEFITKKYKAKKFIAYLQNYSNTYMSFEKFKKVIEECIIEDIVEIAISTRPDCINDDYLQYLYNIKEKNNIEVSIELGLQTVNYHTLEKINRGHSLAEFIDAVLRIKKYGFPTCVHIILNLPWDTKIDVIENAKIISALKIEQVKLHSLYIVKNTILGTKYKNGDIKMISCDDYKERVILFLEHLSPEIVIQRIMARAPEEETLFANWGRSWWIILEEIEKEMSLTNRYQGKKCNYLNGSALRGLNQQ